MNPATDYFDRCAPRWECRKSPEEERKIGLILARLNPLPQDSLLDIGCGTGVLLPFLQKLGVQDYTALDASAGMAREFRRQFPAIRFVNEDWQKTGLFPENSFSKIIVYNAFPHFSSPQAALTNSFSALRSGGVLCVAHSRTREALERHHRRAGGPVATHALPAETAFRALYAEAGFRNVIMENQGYFYSSGEKP